MRKAKEAFPNVSECNFHWHLSGAHKEYEEKENEGKFVWDFHNFLCTVSNKHHHHDEMEWHDNWMAGKSEYEIVIEPVTMGMYFTRHH